MLGGPGGRFMPAGAGGSLRACPAEWWVPDPHLGRVVAAGLINVAASDHRSALPCPGLRLGIV